VHIRDIRGVVDCVIIATLNSR